MARLASSYSERKIVARHGHAGSARQAVVEQLRAVGTGAQAGVLGVDVAGGEADGERRGSARR